MEVYKVWALPVSLATTSGIVVYFLFLGVLRCFSSPGYRSPSLYIQLSANRHYSAQVSPFGYFRFIAWLAAPRNFSQLSTSFIGILRQGILCVRLSNFLCTDNWLVIGKHQLLLWYKTYHMPFVLNLLISSTKLLSYELKGIHRFIPTSLSLHWWLFRATCLNSKIPTQFISNNRGGQAYLAVIIATV